MFVTSYRIRFVHFSIVVFNNVGVFMIVPCLLCFVTEMQSRNKMMDLKRAFRTLWTLQVVIHLAATAREQLET